MIDLSRYSKPALQFSGGKDSLACLYLMRGMLDRVTVYWMNTGDGCPETLSVVEQVRGWIPKFVEVRSDVAEWRRAHGTPTDLVPAKAHALGRLYGLNPFGLTNRFDCCFWNLMKPLHDRMVLDGIDAVVRGTKICDTGQLPAEGHTNDYDIVLPLRAWTHAEVFGYLNEVDAPSNAIYEHFRGISAPECMGCTAWWDDGKAAYLRAKHPHRLHEYQASLALIKQALRSHLDDLETELNEG